MNGNTIAGGDDGHNDAFAELSERVAEAVNNGETVVIDAKNVLAYSGQAAVGSTGAADDPPAAGGKQVPAFDSGSW